MTVARRYPIAHYSTVKIRPSIFIALSLLCRQNLRAQDADVFPGLSASFGGAEAPHLAPTAAIEQEIREDLGALHANIGVEVLMRDSVDTAGNMLSAANTLLSVHGLEGLEYYSVSHHKMRILFERSFAISDDSSREPLPDPVVSTIPASGEFLAYQRDTTFGDNVFLVTYEVDETEIHLRFRNLTPFWYGPIRLVAPGNMGMHVYLVANESGVHYYGVFGARSINIRVLADRVHTSFYNRLIALYRWYASRRIGS